LEESRLAIFLRFTFYCLGSNRLSAWAKSK